MNHLSTLQDFKRTILHHSFFQFSKLQKIDRWTRVISGLYCSLPCLIEHLILLYFHQVGLIVLIRLPSQVIS